MAEHGAPQAAQFKSALSEAADRAFSAGQITPDQARDIQDIAKGASVNRAGALQFLVQHVMGLATSAGAIDWAGLVAALQNLMPLILQIIALFKTPAQK